MGATTTRSYTTKGTSERIVEGIIGRAAELLAAAGQPDELIVRDTDLKGFCVRLRASGRHVYGVAYQRGKFLTLGPPDRLTAGKARKAAREALAETSLDGAPARVERRDAALTFGGFLDEHYEPWAKSHLKTADETLQRLRAVFATFLSVKLVDLTAFAVERWRTNRIKTDKVSKATTNRDLTALKAAVAKAVTWGHLKVHPLTSVKPYRLDTRGVVRYLNAEELTRLKAALTARDDRRRAERESANTWRRARDYDEWAAYGTYTDHLTPIVLLGLNTGLRRGELFALRWADVDLVAPRLTVQGGTSKGGQTRYVPLNSDAITALTTWRDQVISGNTLPDLVFPSASGEKFDTIKTVWRALMKAAKITDFRFHDLRHTFASRLVQRGVNLNTVRELLGHADMKMTLRYSHLAPENTAAAVARLVDG
jgi:integrase